MQTGSFTFWRRPVCGRLSHLAFSKTVLGRILEGVVIVVPAFPKRQETNPPGSGVGPRAQQRESGEGGSCLEGEAASLAKSLSRRMDTGNASIRQSVQAISVKFESGLHLTSTSNTS
eukprot:6206932-Pleurochrysis_carterae.AAC.3